jgi:hypothetical protein
LVGWLAGWSVFCFFLSFFLVGYNTGLIKLSTVGICNLISKRKRGFWNSKYASTDRCFFLWFFSLLLSIEISFAKLRVVLSVSFVLTAHSLQLHFPLYFQATRDKGSNAEYASSMFTWIVKRRWGAASPNLDSCADRSLRQRLKHAFRSRYRMKKVSIAHNTTSKAQSSDKMWSPY